MPNTTLLGRERELDDIVQLVLRGVVRLLTLTGAGGTGKSRLALAAAVELSAAFEEVVWLVDLAAVSEAGLVSAAVGEALGIEASPHRSLPTLLGQKLAERPGLLVLDNFEQVLDAATVIGDLLAACPGLVVLATSREPLGLRAEHLFQVDPLAVPGSAEMVDLHTAGWLPSLVLFEDRAQAQRGSFRLTERNVAAIAEICVRLDGLPLAIELAAAQAGVFSPQTILTRLVTSAPLVLSGSRDLPRRHQTLRATVAWSYDLLPPALQAIFCCCGVFAGGFTAEAVAAVGGALPVGDRLPGQPPTDTLATLAQLVLKSLVSVSDLAAPTPRFSMLKIIRAYALDRLTVSGGLDEARQRHAVYYVGLAEAARAGGPGASDARHPAALEHPNFRAVFDWSAETGNVIFGRRLAAALEPPAEDAVSERQPSAARRPAAAKTEAPKAAPRLTPREREIAGLVVAGRSNREIASALFVGVRTVETHLEHVFRKLSVQSRAGVAVWGVKNGLLPPPAGRR